MIRGRDQGRDQLTVPSEDHILLGVRSRHAAEDVILHEPVEALQNLVDLLLAGEAPHLLSSCDVLVVVLPLVSREVPVERLGVVGVSDAEVAVLRVGKVAYLPGVERGHREL